MSWVLGVCPLRAVIQTLDYLVQELFIEQHTFLSYLNFGIFMLYAAEYNPKKCSIC